MAQASVALDEAFIQKCREAFNTFDEDASGTIDTQEMKLLLEAIGETPTEEELFRFMAEVDEDGTGEIEFAEFLRAFEKQRGANTDPEEQEGIRCAYTALGGVIDWDEDLNDYQTVEPVTVAALQSLVKDEFCMTIDIPTLISGIRLNMAKEGGDIVKGDTVLDFGLFSKLFDC